MDVRARVAQWRGRLRMAEARLESARTELRAATVEVAKVVAEMGDGPAPLPVAGPELLDEALDRPLFSRGGVFHRVNVDEVFEGRFQVPVPLQRLELAVTIRTGDDIRAIGEKLFWLGLPNNRNLLGFAIVRGSKLALRSGLGMPFGREKMREVGVFAIRPNRTYRLSFVFERDRVRLRVSLPSEIAAGGWAPFLTLEGRPTLRGRFPRNKTALVTFGGDGSSHEPFQPGWEFSDLSIRAT